MLGSDLDYARTIDRVVSVFVSFLADWCLVALSDDEDGLRRVRVAHASRAKSAAASRLEELERDVQYPLVTRAVLDVRQSLLMSHIEPRWLMLHARDPEHLEVLKQLGADSLLAIPLVARDECFGAIVIVSTDPRRRFTEASVPFAEEIARRSAMALANARLYERAQQAIQARDDILAVVAHDLRSPLHVIEFAAQRLRQNAPGPGRRSTDRSLDWILSSAQRATSLVRDLLDRAKLEWQALELETEAVDPADVVRDVARRSEPLATLGSLRVQTKVGEAVPKVQADRVRLVQALENLVGNAMKFTSAGGTVTIGAEPGEGEVRFFVSDTGNGIEPEDLEHIFDRFWQARGADARGAGLGLSICKRIVEAHGGRVWVESEVGEGTTVSFVIRTMPLD